MLRDFDESDADRLADNRRNLRLTQAKGLNVHINGPSVFAQSRAQATRRLKSGRAPITLATKA